MSVKNITVHQAHQKQADGYTYVDVRSIPEFANGHPAGAVNVPLLHRDERTGQMTPNRDFLQVMEANFPRDARLLIGCQVGGRSAQAAELLASAGYSDVTNVLGGFGGARDQFTGRVNAEGWASSGLPVESGETPGRSYDALRAAAAKGHK
jgi:rhodanese-related sulfurtransferase